MNYKRPKTDTDHCKSKFYKKNYNCTSEDWGQVTLIFTGHFADYFQKQNQEMRKEMNQVGGREKRGSGKWKLTVQQS